MPKNRTKMMRALLLIIIFTVLKQIAFADIAPMPITVHSIKTNRICDIQMIKEDVTIQLYPDSSIVECEFYMRNFGDSITIPVGFPVMNFSHYDWDAGIYSESDINNFQITIDGKILSKEDIHAPLELDSLYKALMNIYSSNRHLQYLEDSIYKHYGVIIKKNKTVYPKGTYDIVEKELNKVYEIRRSNMIQNSKLRRLYREKMKQGRYLWYVWDTKFKEGETRKIKVQYKLPIGMGYGANYRYMEYLINTGKNWKGDIVEANIIVNLMGVKQKNIEEISPSDYHLNNVNQTISWKFSNIEPTTDDDIYIRFFNPKERRNYERTIIKREKRISRSKKKNKSTAL